MRVMITFLLTAVALFGQAKGTPVTVTRYPAAQPTQLLDYTSSIVTYIGYAVPIQPVFTWTFAGSTLTSIVVLTNVGTVTTSTAHGLAVGNQVIVTGSGTTALNATYRIATVPSATTFTIATSGVGNATYTTGLVMTTTAPRSTAAVWSIECFQNDGTNITAIQWAGGSPAIYTYAWSNRTTTACW